MSVWATRLAAIPLGTVAGLLGPFSPVPFYAFASSLKLKNTSPSAFALQPEDCLLGVSSRAAGFSQVFWVTKQRLSSAWGMKAQNSHSKPSSHSKFWHHLKK